MHASVHTGSWSPLQRGYAGSRYRTWEWIGGIPSTWCLPLYPLDGIWYRGWGCKFQNQVIPTCLPTHAPHVSPFMPCNANPPCQPSMLYAPQCLQNQVSPTSSSPFCHSLWDGLMRLSTTDSFGIPVCSCQQLVSQQLLLSATRLWRNGTMLVQCDDVVQWGCGDVAIWCCGAMVL